MTKKLGFGHGVVGILGGGQLARMLALAAAEYGIECVIYSDSDEVPAKNYASKFIHADYGDLDALKKLSDLVDVITYEFENIPLETVQFLEKLQQNSDVSVYPSSYALNKSQDRLFEKQLFTSLDLPVAPYQQVDDIESLHSAIDKIGLPSILKTRRMGYDGKGQVGINHRDDAKQALDLINYSPAILEKRIPFDVEFSVIASRALDSSIEIWPITQNEHKNHILAISQVPAPEVSALVSEKAKLAAEKVLKQLDYVGVFALEFFGVADSEHGFVINEMAPRVHNSGHWTQDASNISQFHQHIRAICGLPLVQPKLIANCQMVNLIGEDILHLDPYYKQVDAHIHLYGKKQIKVGRKMGHVNILSQQN